MTIKELKIVISELPDNMPVYVPSQSGDYDYGRVYSVSVEDIDDERNGIIEACVIDEK